MTSFLPLFFCQKDPGKPFLPLACSQKDCFNFTKCIIRQFLNSFFAKSRIRKSQFVLSSLQFRFGRWLVNVFLVVLDIVISSPTIRMPCLHLFFIFTFKIIKKMKMLTLGVVICLSSWHHCVHKVDTILQTWEHSYWGAQ